MNLSLKQKSDTNCFLILIRKQSKKLEIKLKSLILAQIERWRNALHMQVERQHRELAL